MLTMQVYEDLEFQNQILQPTYENWLRLGPEDKQSWVVRTAAKTLNINHHSRRLKSFHST